MKKLCWPANLRQLAQLDASNAQILRTHGTHVMLQLVNLLMASLSSSDWAFLAKFQPYFAGQIEREFDPAT